MIRSIFKSSIAILVLISCKEYKNENSDSGSYSFNKGKSGVEMKILSGHNYLIYDTPIKTNFEWTNIDPKTSSIIGMGIRILETKNGVTKTEINVPENILKSDTVSIKVNFKINGENTRTEFHVPIKTKR